MLKLKLICLNYGNTCLVVLLGWWRWNNCRVTVHNLHICLWIYFVFGLIRSNIFWVLSKKGANSKLHAWSWTCNSRLVRIIPNLTTSFLSYFDTQKQISRKGGYWTIKTSMPSTQSSWEKGPINQGHFCHHSVKSVTRYQTTAVFNMADEKLGLDKQSYKTHFFRIETALSAWVKGSSQ